MFDDEILQTSFSELTSAPCFQLFECCVERCRKDLWVGCDNFETGFEWEVLLVYDEVKRFLPLTRMDVCQLWKLLESGRDLLGVYLGGLLFKGCYLFRKGNRKIL